MNVENIVVDIEINNSIAPDIEQSIVATIDNNINVIKDDTDDLDVTINRKEYVITGDEIYIPKRYEDAPTWLQNMIDQVVEYSIGAKVSDMNQVVYSLNQMIEAMEVSKNTYEMSVISSNDIDTRINTAITTLNSNMNEADATILSVANTKTTPEEAEAIMINAVRAELESTEAGTIGAAVATLSTAIANEEEARSTSVETLYSTMEGEFEATARAFNTINTYVGLDEVGASTGTGLSGYLEGTDGQIGSAGSQLINDIELKTVEVESKFAYNSTVKLNGVTHTSGFGIATTINSDSIPEGDSQFWVSADEFKIVGANQTADAQGPFTVNTTTGDITFRGKVTFNSGQIGTIDEAIAQVVETVSVGDKNINITDNLIPTTSLVADTYNSGYQLVGTPVKSNTAGFSSFAEPQISMITGDEAYSLYVDEITIPYYYRFAIKGLVGNADLSKFKIVTVDSLGVVTYSTVIATISETLISTEWYEIDGIINPVGGDTAVASGSIRKSDGTKIGIINNFALPSGSVKLLLGWYGECIVSRMKLAKITADTLTGNYVTQDYVDNGINSKVSSATTDEIAEKLGYIGDGTYSAYEKMAMAAALGQTIINGGYLRTSLIEANSIVANQINTTGLVAENISSNTIDGKTITGSFITGAVITGATIKASYIDLDGELEVLTDFYLCVGGDTTGVPALAISEGRYRTYNSLVDTDAVPSSGYANIYRIPTLSTVTFSTSFTSLSSGQALYATLWSYNTANVNNNKKSRKKRPTFNQGAGIIFQFTEYRNDSSYEDYDLCSHSLKLGSVTLLNFSFFGWSARTGGSGGSGVTNTGFSWSKYGGQPGYTEYANPYANIQQIEGYAQTFTTSSTVTAIPVIGDVNITATIVVTPHFIPGEFLNYWTFPSQVTFTVTCVSSGYELPFDWVNTTDRLYWVRNNTKGGGQCRFLNLSINNMI